jgi:succinate-semialdehyde dehydrogenase / glutarate-semialdehyde dehydrogenase
MTDILRSVNPATGETIGEYSIHTEIQIEEALESSMDTFSDWRLLPFSKRAVVLKKIARVIRKEKDDLVRMAALEMGKPLSQGYYEVEKCAKTLEFYAANGAGFLKDEKVKTDARKSYVSFQPLGAVLAIMPWNFPFWQVFRAFAPTVMAGNVMVLKHASNVSGCALMIEDIILRAGAPKGLLQTLLIPSHRAEALIDDRRIAAVTLTGSTEAGRKVAAAAGRNLKKVVLELGGSDPYIILEDADMDKAVEIAVRGRLVNTGQSCIAAKRFVVHRSVKKEFQKRFTAEMKIATYGDPFTGTNRMGPMARIDLRDQLHQQVLDSIALGAKLLCGGFIPDLAGAFYPPTVLTNVKKGMPAYDEELFGPVAAIIEAKNDRAALEIANDTVYGLGGGIISQDWKKAEKMAALELNAGNCYVNDFVHSDPLMPFGGVKQSGYGRELSSFGIREFVNIKSVYIK